MKAELAAAIAACERTLGRSLSEGEKIDFVLDNYPDVQDAAEASKLIGNEAWLHSFGRVAAELFGDPSLEARTLLHLMNDCSVAGEALHMALDLARDYLAKRR